MKLDRTNRLLLGTLAILGGLALLRFADGLRPAESLWSIPPVSGAAVTSILWTTPDGVIALQKADSGWSMTEPIQRSADGDRIGTLLRDWAEGFTPDLRLDPRPSKETLAQVELDEEHRSELKIEGPAGTLVHVYLGKKIGGGSHYVARPGDPSVFRGRIPGGFRLDVDPEAWRDKRLFPFAKDDLAGLEIDGSEGSFAFRRIETPERAYWEGVRPDGFEPSSRALDQMGRSLGNLKAVRILEGADADAARISGGLESPRLVVRAETESGARYRLSFGADNAEEGTVLAALDGDDRVFALAMSVAGQFDKDATQLRDKTALRVRRDEDPRITWTEGGRQVVVIPEGDRDWKVVEPADFAPEERELNLAANSLLNLQAADVLFEPPPELPDDGPRIDVETTSGTHTLRIAAAPDQNGRHLAIVQGREPVFVLRGAVVERLLRTFRGEATE